MLLLFVNGVWCQSVEKMVTAKIVVDTTAIEKVNVLNLRNYKTRFPTKKV
jgi:hypothetical protein